MKRYIVEATEDIPEELIESVLERFLKGEFSVKKVVITAQGTDKEKYNPSREELILMALKD